MARIDANRSAREALLTRLPQGAPPLLYLIVASGNIYEDRTAAVAAAEAGAQIIAVIRSTAQSLIDYVPYGATTEEAPRRTRGRVLQTFFGKSLAQADAVLDWGCGCGRVFRYFPPERLTHFTGIDIDRDNIAWCKENFPAARFETVSPRPPTPLRAAEFDVVFGISVFTHLTEENHFDWLEELARITRPGAAVPASVHGETAWMLSGFPLERYAEWRSHGYLVAGKNFDLDDAYADTSLYVNSFISRRYVYENWSRNFRVVDVLPGAIGNFQDLVVLERT